MQKYKQSSLVFKHLTEPLVKTNFHSHNKLLLFPTFTGILLASEYNKGPLYLYNGRVGSQQLMEWK